MGGVDEVADVARPDRVERVLLLRVGQRHPERAAARQRQVVAVARVLLGVELAQQAGVREQAVQVRRLLLVADDRVVVLVLEVEQEDVLEARHPRGRRGGRPRRADRRRDGQAQVAGHGPVVPGDRRVRAVDVAQRGGQHQPDLRGRGPGGQRPGAGPAGQHGVAAAGPADRADDPLGQQAPARGQEPHPDLGPARRRAAQPGRQPVAGAARRRPARGQPQRGPLHEAGGAPRAPREQPPARGRPGPGGAREAAGAVAHHRRQAGRDPPARDRDRVPALGRGRADAALGVDDQVAALPRVSGAGRPGGRDGRLGRRQGSGAQGRRHQDMNAPEWHHREALFVRAGLSELSDYSVNMVLPLTTVGSAASPVHCCR